ncbi:LuxR C-terminal-related transcriptional regulator [Microvirga terrestris]|uniref:Response regulator transcription factor n=1 Tax=Microvirga terrestris TaxID=2791024 RepID=A0ABS0HQQ3_9HYPH|nr:response regulator transcription factor [Microvirga terrestris]MBF9195803.1 response regulator transcription factor [Microvirga terrestris]
MSLHNSIDDRRILQLEEKPKTTVFTICGNPLLRIGLETVLAGEGFTIWHEAIDDVSILPEVHDESHALFLIDGESHSDAAVSVVQRIKMRFPGARIVILAEMFEPDAISAAWKAGAHGFCLTNSQREILIGFLELVMLGETVLPSAFVLSMAKPHGDHATPSPAENIEGSEAYRSPGRKLSAREAQILEYLREGAPNKVIARQLNLSESTVKVHVKAILKKVGACNRTQAALWANRHVATDAEI